MSVNLKKQLHHINNANLNLSMCRKMRKHQLSGLMEYGGSVVSGLGQFAFHEETFGSVQRHQVSRREARDVQGRPAQEEL